MHCTNALYSCLQELTSSQFYVSYCKKTGNVSQCMYCIILQLYFSYFPLSLCLSLHPPSLYRIPPISLSLLITLTFQLSSYTHPLSPPLSPSHFLSGLPLSTKVVTIFVPSDSLLQPFVSAHLPDPVLIQLARLSHSLLFSSSFSPRIFSPV